MIETFVKDKAKDEFKIARVRGMLYSFLAHIYSIEINLNFLRQVRKSNFIQTFSDLGIRFEKDFLEKSEKDLLNEMSLEYTRLFIGPGKHISPHESVHRKGEGLLWGDSTVKVKNFIKSSGLRYSSDFKGMPDHISVELEFMHRLVQAEIEAIKENAPTKLKKIQKLQRYFIDEHISKWIPQFTDKIAKETILDFYRKIAELTKEFILFEKRRRYGKE